MTTHRTKKTNATAPRGAAGPVPETITELLGTQGRDLATFWQQVVDTMNDGLLLVGPDRRIVYLNAKGEQLVGRKLEDIRGALCVDAINCPQCKCCCRLFEEGGAEGVEVTVFDDARKRSRVLRKNARLLRGARGELLGGVETFTDITHEVRQRQESERYTAMLFEQKTRIDALLGAMEDGVFSVDGDFKVLTFAPRMSEMLGVDERDAVGRHIGELLEVTDGCFDGGCATALDGRTFRVHVRLADGRVLPADVSLRRVRMDDGEMLGILRLHGCPGGDSDVQGREFHGIISQSSQMRDIFRLLESAAQSNANILIEGESGVGKELVARAIHRLSPRHAEPFHAVNCATFAGSLLVSELFGHERGAFTGAFRTTKGKLELAGAGTLFLDEVSEIPLHYQAVLLRVLEERQFERVGGQRTLEMRARIIAATNERLTEAVRARRFREDLFFRLKVVPIHVPPLRQRREDIPLLANYFANHPAVNLTAKHVRLTDEALDVLNQHHWPGNVRELRNLMEYLCFVADDVIDVSHLPLELRSHTSPSRPQRPLSPARSPSIGESTQQDERTRVLDALQQARYRRAEAARILGIDRTTLWRKMKRLAID